jgi:quercetin dioxygenase-like cupin family protein
MDERVRRVVTGHTPDGTAVIVSDGPTPFVHKTPQRPGHALHEIWATSETPAVIDRPGEPTDRPRSLEPPTNGTIWRIVVFPPERSFIDTITREDARAAYAAVGSPGAVVEIEEPAHPFMHRTKTIDYGIVLSGEIYLVLDKSETLLNAGDVVVQRGTNHAWSNRSDAPCRMAFVLIDGA